MSLGLQKCHQNFQGYNPKRYKFSKITVRYEDTAPPQLVNHGPYNSSEITVRNTLIPGQAPHRWVKLTPSKCLGSTPWMFERHETTRSSGRTRVSMMALRSLPSTTLNLTRSFPLRPLLIGSCGSAKCESSAQMPLEVKK